MIPTPVGHYSQSARDMGSQDVGVQAAGVSRLPSSPISISSGNYNLANVLPPAPDMAQLRQGVRSVAGKLSVFANGVMTSIQVSGVGLTLSCA